MGFYGPDFPNPVEMVVMGAVLGFLLCAFIAVALWVFL